MIWNGKPSERDLPAGWELKRLDEVCEFLDSRRQPVKEADRRLRIAGKAQCELYPYYGANGQAGWIDHFLFDEPLILLAEDGGAFGSKSKPIAYAVQGKFWVNNHAHVLRPRDGVNFDFCLYALSIRPDVGDLATGNTRPKLNKAIAAGIPMPLPPLAEQKRIAGILKEKLAAVDRARAAAAAQLEAAKALPAAYLREILSSAEAAGWPVKRLGDLLTAIEAGKCVSCVERPAKPTEWGVLKVSAVTWGAFRPEENKVLPDDFEVPADREVRNGDFLISRSNTTELVGAVVHVKKTRPRLMLSDKTLRLVPRDDKILREYMELTLRSPQCRSFIEEKATGASSSMKNITQDTIRDIPLPGTADR